jgi:hypothetical protein
VHGSQLQGGTDMSREGDLQSPTENRSDRGGSALAKTSTPFLPSTRKESESGAPG